MPTNVQELYTDSVRLLSEEERRQLAHLILAGLAPSLKISGDSHDELPLVAEPAEAKRQKAIAWIKAHRASYGGMYVALDGDKLLGTGRNYVEAMKAARAAKVAKAFVDYVHTPDYVGSMGGW